MIKATLISMGIILSTFTLTAALQAQTVSIENLPPVVVNTIPEAGDSCVNSDLSEIRVTFSKEMTDNSWSIVQVVEENYPEFKGSPRYLEDNRTCVFEVSLQPDRTYVLWLNNERFRNFKDRNKLSALPYLLTFKTARQ